MLKNTNTPIAAVLLTLAVLIVAPGVASAASVEVTAAGDHYFAAELGENNDLQVNDVGDEIAFSDPVGVTAGPGCEQIDANAAKCPDADLETIYVYVSTGTNVVTANTAHETFISGHGATKNTFHGGFGGDWLFSGDGDDELYGGLGQDHIEGSGGRDLIGGGAGDDELEGGPDADSLAGGDADDDLAGGSGDDALDGGPGADSIEGGDGADTADYSARTGDVNVSIGSNALLPNDGEQGEGDNVRADIESVRDGSGDDELQAALVDGVAAVMRGFAGADTLVGNASSNTLQGGKGRDLVVGLKGEDRLIGNGGRDTLRGRDRGRDTVNCGAGRDRFRADRVDGLRSCEQGRAA